MAPTSNPQPRSEPHASLLAIPSFREVDAERFLTIPRIFRLVGSLLVHALAAIAFLILIPTLFFTGGNDNLASTQQPPPIRLVAPPDRDEARPKPDDLPPSLCHKCPLPPPPPPEKRSLFKAVAKTGAEVRLQFPNRDLNQYLPLILARYRPQGSRVGFGDGWVVKYLFDAPPDSTQLATPEEGIALDYFFWLSIEEPEQYRFISDIRTAHPDTRLMTPYALFPLSFQDVIEDLIRSHPGKCPARQVAIGNLEFDIQPGPGAKVLSVTCAADSSTRVALKKISSK